MRSDVHDYCKSCLICVLRKGGCRPSRPPLHPTPVGGPFHRDTVDVLQLPLYARGNRYVVVFLDYFTEWAEAFAVPNQKAETVARLFVEPIVVTVSLKNCYQRSQLSFHSSPRYLQNLRSEEY